MQNLHRNVIFRGSNVPNLPFSRLDSQNPEDLWKWMDENRADGMEALAIPHDANGSNGQMFRLATFEGTALDGKAYATGVPTGGTLSAKGLGRVSGECGRGAPHSIVVVKERVAGGRALNADGARR